jgi:hypothetical protein
LQHFQGYAELGLIHRILPATLSATKKRRIPFLHAFMKGILNAAADCCFLTLSDEDGTLSNANEFEEQRPVNCLLPVGLPLRYLSPQGTSVH